MLSFLLSTNESATTITTETTLALITAENALVKTIKYETKLAPTHLLLQLADPVNNRPIKDNEKTRMRLRDVIYNPQTGTWATRSVNGKRGQPKQTPYTKKTAVSLLPTDGKMSLCARSEQSVGLIFNLEECHLKQGKYIFPQGIYSHSKWWLRSLWDEQPKLHRALPIEQLRVNNRNCRRLNYIPYYNELLVGLSKKSLSGVFATQNNSEARLAALAMQYQIGKVLNMIVPLLIINKEDGVIIYTEAQQLVDLRTTFKNQPEKIKLMFDQPVVDHLTLLDQKDQHQLEQRKALAALELHELALDETLSDAAIIKNFTLVEIEKSFYLLWQAAKDDSYRSRITTRYRIIKEKDFNAFTQLRNSKNPVNLIIKKTAEYQQREMIHACDTKPEKLGRLFMKNEAKQDLATILLFLKYVPTEQINQKETMIIITGYDYDEDSIIPKTKAIQDWPVLLNILLMNIPEVTQLMFRHHAKQLPELLKKLRELQKLYKKYPKAPSTLHRIYCDAMIMKIVVELNNAQKIKFQFDENTQPIIEQAQAQPSSYTNRRNIEPLLLKEIKQLKTLDAVYAFHRDCLNAKLLSQHRHEWYDACRGLLFPTVKVNLLNALKQQEKEIKEIHAMSHITTHHPELVKLKAALEKILNDKQQQLIKPVSTSFFNPISTEKTTEKNKEIKQALADLEAIHSLAALQFFVAKLLVNTKLTAHRGIGFGLSDLSIKLRDFYQQHSHSQLNL